jgi:hypothetical protein
MSKPYDDRDLLNEYNDFLLDTIRGVYDFLRRRSEEWATRKIYRCEACGRLGKGSDMNMDYQGDMLHDNCTSDE